MMTSTRSGQQTDKHFWAFIARFTLLHFGTYLLVGLVFFYISDYTALFAESDFAEFMRPTDDPRVALAIPMQIPRGALLALALFPFRAGIVATHGWLKLGFLMWVLMGIGAVITGPGSIEGWLYTRFGFGNLLVGWPEITVQMFLFAWLLSRWERQQDQRYARQNP